MQTTSQLWILLAFNINRDYIAANLCINRFDRISVCKGSCYLEDRLSKNNQKPEQYPDLKQKEITLFCQLMPALRREIPELSLLPCYFARDDRRFSSPFLQSIFHPPSTTVEV